MECDFVDGCALGKEVVVDPEDPFNLSLGSQSELTDSQRPTQPLYQDDDDDEIIESSDDEEYEKGTWGILHPVRDDLFPIILKENEVTVGRTSGCSFVIKSSDVSACVFKVLSKKQFKIVRKGDDVRIFDLSTNGTQVNGDKISKLHGNTLPHNSTIELVDFRAWCFLKVDKAYQNRHGYPKIFRKQFAVSDELGSGAAGTVIRAFRRKDRKAFAVKCVDKSKIRTNDFVAVKRMFGEVEILKKLDHPNIIKFESKIDTEAKLYIVLELAYGGELFDMVVKQKLSEFAAKCYFLQMVSAVKYLHKKNIAHRDLKPENILLCTSQDTQRGCSEIQLLKITDMGLSKELPPHLLSDQTFCGTPQYLAPEMLMNKVRKGGYGTKVDCWSLGIILYIMMSGCQPFRYQREDKKEILSQILEVDYKYEPEDVWSKISKEAIDLIEKCICKNDRDQRWSAKQIYKHPWMNDKVAHGVVDNLLKKQGYKREADDEDEEDDDTNGNNGRNCKRVRCETNGQVGINMRR